MKKRIVINVQPADNGYTIQGNVSDANQQNARQVNLVAKTDDEVKRHLAEFMEMAFTPATAPSGGNA
jgi:hypothetical protein